MRSLLILTCIVLLTDNILVTTQHSKFNKASLNYPTNNNDIQQRQGEYNYPSYYNSYQQLLTNNNYKNDDPMSDYSLSSSSSSFSNPSSSSSNFPSLVSSNILLNGGNSLSKYKQSQLKSNTINPELRNWLASIKAIQPVVDERLDLIGDYINVNRHRPAAQKARNIPLTAIKTGQAEYYDLPFETSYGDANNVNDKYKTVLPLQAEGMANSYDEIEDLSDSRLDPTKRQESSHTVNTIASIASKSGASKTVNEPKSRRMLTSSSGEPSLLQNNRNVVQSPKSYQQSIDSVSRKEASLSTLSDIYFVAIVACISSIAIFSVIGAGYCFYKVQQSNKAAQDVEFPAYGVIGPVSRLDSGNVKCSSPPSDRKLAQSAQMYHYHHQKQQMISTEKNSTNIPRHTNTGSDIESDEENEDGEYTVYECPGLAPTGEMEVKNPLFQDDLTPISSPSVNNGMINNKQADSPKNVVESQLTKEAKTKE